MTASPRNLGPHKVRPLPALNRMPHFAQAGFANQPPEFGSNSPKYRAYTGRNLDDMPFASALSPEQRGAIQVVSAVLPFKTNNYVVEQLIRWDDIPADPMFVLNFPQAGMLLPHHYEQVKAALESPDCGEPLDAVVNRIRAELNPHPAGQLEHNVPELDGEKLPGMQHKYRETVLFFPSNGQTCHAYCTFCFRWPQFIGDASLKFASREASQLVGYLRAHPEVTDVLFTGGDPLVMSAPNLAAYLQPLLEARLPGLQTIRIGTKSLSYWPYRFTTDPDAPELLALFRRVARAGIHLSVMGHFNHPRELSTPVAKEAIERILATGAQIRTQSPIMQRINDDPAAWAEMWRKQVRLGCVPYYMFVARDTGAQHYFRVPLVRAWNIYREAYNQVSGIARTVRGPSMSADLGKVAILGPVEVHGERALALSFIQARNSDWVGRPFFVRYDEDAAWLDDLEPAFGEERFFFQE